MNKTLFKFSVIKVNNLGEKTLMNAFKKNEDELIKKISEILKDFHDFDKPFLNNKGDIILKKNIKSKGNEVSILTNIFKEMIKNDEKKTGFKTLFRILNIKKNIKIKIMSKAALTN